MGRRSRPVAAFVDRNTIEWTLIAVITYECQSQGYETPFPMTQDS